MIFPSNPPCTRDFPATLIAGRTNGEFLRVGNRFECGNAPPSGHQERMGGIRMDDHGNMGGMFS
jgi:hypothetical protein